MTTLQQHSRYFAGLKVSRAPAHRRARRGARARCRVRQRLGQARRASASASALHRRFSPARLSLMLDEQRPWASTPPPRPSCTAALRSSRRGLRRRRLHARSLRSRRAPYPDGGARFWPQAQRPRQRRGARIPARQGRAARVITNVGSGDALADPELAPNGARTRLARSRGRRRARRSGASPRPHGVLTTSSFARRIWGMEFRALRLELPVRNV